MAGTHGIYTGEQETSILAPVETEAGIPVIIGTAPIHLVGGIPERVTNMPVLLNSYAEAVNTLGYSDDWEKYTICEAVYFYFRVMGVGPIICINTWDGGYTEQEVEALTAQTVTTAMTEGSLWVTDENGVVLTEDIDYTVKYGASTTVTAKETISGKTVVLHYHAAAGEDANPTESAIIGGVDENGDETGIEAVRRCYPVLGKIPGILLAPGFSHKPTVSAALKAKCVDLNGQYKVMSFIDIDSTNTGAVTYTGVKSQKEKQGLDSTHQFAVWGMPEVGGLVFHGSVVAAAVADYTDAENEGVPYVSPSNKSCGITGMRLMNGKKVMIDQEQANIVNEYGIATFINRSGWRLWGNYTCAYPGSTDVKDMFLSVRRMFNWKQNNFIETFFQKVDDPANYRLIESVVDSYNQTGNYYVSMGYCARDEIVYLESENPVTNILGGKIRFHTYFSPYTPAQVIEDIFEFDPTALVTALSGE